MIFVTVGTHEQQFNRLIKDVDYLVEIGVIKEEVFIQTGFSTYQPRYCMWKKFLGYKEMEKAINEANLVIAHGGPATFMAVLSKGKPCIVVPRLKKYDEHVNDHQLEFVKKVSRLKGFQFEIIDDKISLKDILVKEFKAGGLESFKSNNKDFIERFTRLTKEILEME